MTEKEKMLQGELYYSFGEELVEERQKAKDAIFAYNHLEPRELEKKNEIIRNLFGKTKEHFFIEPPFYCDYGYNIQIGENFYANYECIMLDGNRIIIGDNVLLGPRVNLFGAGHPIEPDLRLQELEYAKPITIGNNVWVGGNVTINPGVTIGDNVVIGSGSVVTKDIPANVIAVGNPCKVIKEL